MASQLFLPFISLALDAGSIPSLATVFIHSVRLTHTPAGGWGRVRHQSNSFFSLRFNMVFAPTLRQGVSTREVFDKKNKQERVIIKGVVRSRDVPLGLCKP